MSYWQREICAANSPLAEAAFRSLRPANVSVAVAEHWLFVGYICRWGLDMRLTVVEWRRLLDALNRILSIEDGNDLRFCVTH